MEEQLVMKKFYNVVIKYINRDEFGHFAALKGATYTIHELYVSVPDYKRVHSIGGDWKYTWIKEYDVYRIKEAELIFEEAYKQFIEVNKEDRDYLCREDQKKNWYLLSYSTTEGCSSPEWYVEKDEKGKNWKLVREPSYSSTDNKVTTWDLDKLQDIIEYTIPGKRTLLYKEPECII